MLTTRLYSGGTLKSEGFPVKDISEHIAENGCTVWADFVSPTEADLAAIAEELGLHPLAVEDAVHEHQRPKLDRYDTHLFLATYGLSLDPETGQLTGHEITAFITKHALVTVHGPEFDMTAVKKRWDDDVDLSVHGVAFLLWGLLDAVVDGHSAIADQLDTAVELLEDALFDEKPREKEVQRRSFEFRKSLVSLRRLVMPMREVVNTLLRRDLETLDHSMEPYFQDVYDHVLRVSEQTESLRDLVSTILDTNLSIQSNRMNLIMKKVTSWAAIIAVPTAVTGYFGQNVQFAGFGTVWGLWISIGLMVVASVSLYLGFKKRDWI
jgi:magnesium transporter